MELIKAIILRIYYGLRRGARTVKLFVIRSIRTVKYFCIRKIRAIGRFCVRGKRTIERFLARKKRELYFFIRKIRVVGRFFIREGRKIERFFIRRKRELVRFFYRLKKAGLKGVKENLRIYRRNFLYKVLSDKKFFDCIKEQLDQIPESNGGRFYQPYYCKIAIVADEFLYNSYQGIADFIYVTPDNYKEIRDQVDFLLVVSAWRGLNNEWRQMGTIGSEANLHLHEMISYYKEGGKQIVFYSKEDPPNYNHFLPIAKRCDVIFTSAYEMMKEYKKDCGIEEVYTMRFGINPLYHNPIGSRKFPKREEVIFSGSWVKKYPDRIKSLGIIFDGVLASGQKLKIIDRNYSLNSEGFFFPEKYYRYISPAIEHEYLQKAHKLFNWAININSVTDSKTMFANRVYELQAIGNLMLSNRSVGVEEQFKEIVVVQDKDDVKRALTGYTAEEIYEHQMAGVRRVMTGETTFDRVGEMLEKLGIMTGQPGRKVLVLAESVTEILMKQFDEQTYSEKEFLALEQLTDEKWSTADIVTVWNEQCTYGKYYLEDMVNGFKYTACDYICKDAYIIDGRLETGTEHDYVEKIRSIYAAVFWRESISREELREAIEKKCLEKKNGYSIDHFNFELRGWEGVNGNVTESER